MNLGIRRKLDLAFTAATGLSVVLLTLMLMAVLGPMVLRGSSAVFFGSTVEFRKMQRDLFGRVDEEALDAEIAQVEQRRQNVYRMIDEFRQGIDIEGMSDRVRDIHRQFGQELRYKNVPSEDYTRLRGLTRQIRDTLEEAFATQDIEQVRRLVGTVMVHEEQPEFQGTSAEKLFEVARRFLEAARQIDLSHYHEYVAALQEMEGILFHTEERPGLLGPRPGEPPHPLVMLRYGATRWDQARELLHRFRYYTVWEAPAPDEQGRVAQLVAVEKSRADLFEGTSLAALFPYMDEHVDEMLNPRFTFYWQFFIDDNHNSHYFGGVGPEIVGTVFITLIGMLFVVPLGVISAAYLVECASDHWIIRLIRMCINTLAGVPSIVFGLFGLAFFVLFLFPLLGFEPRDCILSASMTLAILTLPVMIRSSEEAIRTVPQSYKEGSLALGASRFRTFVTVTLPAALPGILTGVILSLSRIAGETAPILFTGAVAQGPVPDSIFDRTRTLSYGSYDMAVGDRLAMMVPHNQYGMVVTLIGLILLLNAMAIVLRGRVFRKLKGH